MTTFPCFKNLTSPDEGNQMVENLFVILAREAFENKVQKIISKKRTNGSRVSAIIYFRAKNSRSKFKI